MDKIDRYRSYIKEVIKRHSHPSAYGDVEIQNIFDSENDHYQLVYTGWHKKKRQYGCILHVDIKDGKICIQHDGTETGIANELIDFGVPKDDIVLSYHPPYKRLYTDFTAA